MGIITIAFDDGFADTYTSCAEFLAESGIQATFAVPSSLVGKTLENRDVIDPGQLKHLKELGHEIASHTETHLNMLELLNSEGEEAVKSQMKGSREELEDMAGGKVESFVFPFIENNQDEHLRKLASEYYSSSRITIEGHALNKLPVKDPYSITGTAVTSDMPISEYEKMIEIALRKDVWIIEVFHLVSGENTKSAHRDEPYRFFTHIDDFKKHIRYILNTGIPFITQNRF